MHPDEISRKVFLEALAFDEATWPRSRGWALTRIARVAYYAESDPLFSADVQVTIAAVLGERTLT